MTKTKTEGKIYSVHFRYFARDRVRFVSRAVLAADAAGATRKLLEHVRECVACSGCGGLPVADAARFRHLNPRPADAAFDAPRPPCLGTVGTMPEAELRGRSRVELIGPEVTSGPPTVTITIPEGAVPDKDNTFTIPQGYTPSTAVLR